MGNRFLRFFLKTDSLPGRSKINRILWLSSQTGALISSPYFQSVRLNRRPSGTALFRPIATCGFIVKSRRLSARFKISRTLPKAHPYEGTRKPLLAGARRRSHVKTGREVGYAPARHTTKGRDRKVAPLKFDIRPARIRPTRHRTASESAQKRNQRVIEPSRV